MGLQDGVHGVAGCGAWGCMMGSMGLEDGVRGVAGWGAWGCSLHESEATDEVCFGEPMLGRLSVHQLAQ